MRKIFKFFVLVFLFVFSSGFFIGASGFGDNAIKYLEQVSRIPRVAFTQNEVYTADYLGRVLKDTGYDVVFEEIVFPDNTSLNFEQGEYLSHNIIATKKGSSDLEVIIGASYDSIGEEGSTGFEASTGVALLLDLATMLKDVKLPYTLKFILFGAGKYGSIGSTHYVSTRSQDELNKIMYYLNLSSVGSGKNLYVYANKGSKGFLREGLIDKAKDLGIDLFTSPSIDEYLVPEGVGYDIGDHVPFKYSNVPYGFIEATSWKSIDEEYLIPSDPTEKGIGILDGSSNDNYVYAMETFKKNIEENLSKASELIYNWIVGKGKSIKVVTSLTEENLPYASSITYTLYKDGKKFKSHTLDEKLAPVEFKNLSDGKYKIEVSYPEEINFIKNINEFEFNFDSDGEFTVVNDELGVYTYREEFTDNYISVRQDVQDGEFGVGVKKILFDYSSASQGEYQEDSSNKNDALIKILFIVLIALVALYVLVRIIFSRINKKFE